MPPNNFSLFGNGNNRRQNNQNNQGNGFNNNQNMNFPPNMQQGGQMNQNFNQGYNQNYNQNYNRQMQNPQRNYNRQQMPQQQYQNMPPQQFPNQMQQQYPPQNQMMGTNQMQNNMPMARNRQQQNQQMPNQMLSQQPQQMPNQMLNQQPQQMPNQMLSQQPQMNQIPDLSQMPVYEPLVGQTPVHAQLPAPQSGPPVSYEQLDEKTLAEVQRLINEKRGAEGMPAPIGENSAVPGRELLPVSAVEATFQEKDDKLVEFIQNERNASEFYKYLSEVATKDEYSRTLENISNESSKRSDELNCIYKNIYGRNYDIKKSKVNNSIKFKDGLSWAINVENRSLRDISDYYAKMSNDSYSKQINSVIHKKICDLNYLQTMYTNLKAFF